ncbi:MAG: MBL fold metallo-hydrolase [Erysipelotrichaceae bacterium]|nr:MBL fold metallo-hydrolase [Erysipelotrichaceae bacterium]
MKLIMLGTGNALVTTCFNTCFIFKDNDDYFMVDAGGGNGILRQLKEVNIDIYDIRNLFVSHKHTDHLMGVFWIMRVILQGLNKGKCSGEYHIYGHDEVIGIIRDMSLRLFNEKEISFIDKNVHLHILEDGEEFKVLGRRCVTFDINSRKAKQFGFTMYLDDDRKLTCCGDEPYAECEYEYAKDSDYLLHEAFCLYRDRDIYKPYELYHSTVKDACTLADKLNVKNLILYHTEGNNLKERRKLYTDEGKEYFKGNIIVPDDLDEIDII